MIVYVVGYGSFDASGIHGIYLNEAKAREVLLAEVKDYNEEQETISRFCYEQQCSSGSIIESYKKDSVEGGTDSLYIEKVEVNEEVGDSSLIPCNGQHRFCNCGEAVYGHKRHCEACLTPLNPDGSELLCPACNKPVSQCGSDDHPVYQDIPEVE